MPLRIAFVLSSLNIGGAERQCIELARNFDLRGYLVTVIVLSSGGDLAAELVNSNVRVRSLDKRGRADTLRVLVELVRSLREAKPQFIYSLLPMENLLCLLAGRLVRGARVVWGIRATALDWRSYSYTARILHRAQGLLANLPDAVIANSHAGLHDLALAEDRRRVFVVPNGIDVTRFRRDSHLRGTGRALLGLQEDMLGIGIVGRLDPMKGHDDFIDAAATVAGVRPDTRFLVVGDGSKDARRTLVARASRAGLGERLIFSPAVGPVEEVYNALDLLVVASRFGEGFPNVLAEAMACGTAIVSTDVGEAAAIVGSHGAVVPPGNSKALGSAILEALHAPHGDSSEERRRHIVEHYSIERLVATTETILATLLRS